MLQLNHTALHRIKLHAMQTYPEECCGVLIGRDDGERKTVCDILEIKNAKEENRARRFLITPEDYTWAEKRAREEGVDVMGFYHSHPDHPARPSQFDIDHAMPWCSYVIVSVEAGHAVAVKSWVLLDDHSAFSEEPMEVLEGELIQQCKQYQA
jgi:proteasome lid subunit RPN8/RPN11